MKEDQIDKLLEDFDKGDLSALDNLAWHNVKLLVECGEDPYHACIELGYYVG